MGEHIRSNVVGYLALILALSGTATALRGTNTVFSDDIARGEVKKADIGSNAIGTKKLRDGAVSNTDISGDAVDGSKVAEGSLSELDFAAPGLTGSDVTNLTGADVNESTLGEVPAAKSAGHGAYDFTSAACDPTNATYIVCGTMDMTLPANGRLLILGSGNADSSGNAVGTCALFTSATGGFGAVEAHRADAGGPDFEGGEFELSVVTAPIGPGTVQVEIHCNQTSGNIQFQFLKISAVQISPS